MLLFCSEAALAARAFAIASRNDWDWFPLDFFGEDSSVDVVVDEGDCRGFDLGEAIGVCGLEGFRATGFEVERVVMEVVLVVGGAGGIYVLKLLESGIFRNGEGDTLSLLKGRERVPFDTRLFSFGVEVFLRTVVGVFNSVVEGLLDIDKGVDDSWEVEGFLANEANEEPEGFLFTFLTAGRLEAEALLLIACVVWTLTCGLEAFLWIVEEGT